MRNLFSLFTLATICILCITAACTGTSTNIGTDGDTDNITNPDGDTIYPDGDIDDVVVDGDFSEQAEVEQQDAEEEFDLSMCGVGDSEKPPMVVPVQKVYNGTKDPKLFGITDAQQLAMGALVYQAWNGSWTNFCTGTVVSQDVVLTAAHCMEDVPSASSIKFAIGQNVESPDILLNVKAFHSNPKYNKTSWVPAAHDNAVLILEDNVSETVPEMQTIPMNRDPLTNSLIGNMVQNGGYGSTIEEGENNTRRWWIEEQVASVNSGEFTVNGMGVGGVCFGDSGGPSFYDFGQGVKVIGTVSWGDESCSGIDHFSDIQYDMEWLSNYVEDEFACGSIDDVGKCNGNVVTWCDHGVLLERDCEETDEVCGENSDLKNRCIPDPCGGITMEGQCDEGNVAVWCEDGAIKMRHCEPCAQICEYSGEAFGYYCVDP